MSLDTYENTYRPVPTNAVNEVEARQNLSRNLDRLLRNIQQVLRRNHEAIFAVKEVFRMMLNYLSYISRITAVQFNKWIS